jgi:hypothetical protein
MRITMQFPLSNGGVIALEAESPEALVPSLNWLNGLGIIPAPPSATAGHDVGVKEQSEGTGPGAGEAPAQEKPKAARTRKAPEEKQAEAKQAKAEKSKLTIADVTAATTKVANQKSVAVARELIASFGVGRASDVKPEDFEAFLAKAEQILTAEETAEDVL